MAKTYNKDKHFDLDYFRTKGLAFFDTLDFSDVSNEEIKNIIDCGVPEVEFYQCIFKDLDLSGTGFNQKLSFTQCDFSGNTNFEKCVFHKDTSFTHSVFNGITNFDSIIYEKDLIFSYIRTKPAKFRKSRTGMRENTIPRRVISIFLEALHRFSMKKQAA